MHLILTGATGLVGSAALHSMIHNPSISRITIFSRSPVPQATDTPSALEKCTVNLHSDFTIPPSPEVLSGLRAEARGIVWALGVSQNGIDEKKYTNITYDWPMAWAKAFADAGTSTTTATESATTSVQNKSHFNFVLVSGEGATTKPGMFTPLFGRVKGRVEAALLEVSKSKPESGLKFYSARPGGVDPYNQPDVLKYHEKNFQESKELLKRLNRPMLAFFRTVAGSMMSPTKELGDALVKLASGDGEPMSGPGIDGEGRTLSNKALMRLGKSESSHRSEL